MIDARIDKASLAESRSHLDVERGVERKLENVAVAHLVARTVEGNDGEIQGRRQRMHLQVLDSVQAGEMPVAPSR